MAGLFLPTLRRQNCSRLRDKIDNGLVEPSQSVVNMQVKQFTLYVNRSKIGIFAIKKAMFSPNIPKSKRTLRQFCIWSFVVLFNGQFNQLHQMCVFVLCQQRWLMNSMFVTIRLFDLMRYSLRDNVKWH